MIRAGSVPEKQLSKAIVELQSAHPEVKAFEFRGVLVVPIVVRATEPNRKPFVIDTT